MYDIFDKCTAVFYSFIKLIYIFIFCLYYKTSNSNRISKQWYALCSFIKMITYKILPFHFFLNSKLSVLLICTGQRVKNNNMLIIFKYEYKTNILK